MLRIIEYLVVGYILAFFGGIGFYLYWAKDLLGYSVPDWSYWAIFAACGLLSRWVKH